MELSIQKTSSSKYDAQGLMVHILAGYLDTPNAPYLKMLFLKLENSDKIMRI